MFKKFRRILMTSLSFDGRDGGKSPYSLRIKWATKSVAHLALLAADFARREFMFAPNSKNESDDFLTSNAEGVLLGDRQGITVSRPWTH